MHTSTSGGGVTTTITKNGSAITNASWNASKSWSGTANVGDVFAISISGSYDEYGIFMIIT